ncbi:MAG: alpha/beta hydrolase [Bacteroidales bacterium]|nr:alpha/beta hydrolase [Bacteroidales bacterium]
MWRRALLLLMAAAAMLGACKHPEIEYVDFDSFKVTSIKTSSVFMESGELNPEIKPLEEPYPETPDTKTAHTSGISIARDMLGSLSSNKVVSISGTYTGHDIDGSPLTQSGKLLLPASGPVKNLIIVSHFTIGANTEAPSETFPFEGIFASKGYAVAIADYIGFGVTAKRIHPYMHTHSTAESVVDMALAVKPYLEHIGRAPENQEVILFGYSQGGSTTMAVMEMLQREHADVFPIKKTYAGGGPYDLAATFDFSMAEDKTGIPCAIPMIVQGVSEGEMLGLKMEDFFKPNLLANYDEWINSKKYTVKEINQLINSRSLHEIMTDEGRDKTSASTARLYKAMMVNSVLNFRPTSPVYMFHSLDDTTVPFINASRAEEYLKGNNIEFDFGHYGIHSMGFLRFIINVAKEL